MINQSELLVKLDNAGVYKSSKWLVQGVSLEISKGQIVTLIGPNGSGKTTTAKMVVNMLNTDEGSILRNTKKLAYVPQKIDIDWALPLRVIDFMNLTNDISDSLNCGILLISHDIHFVMSSTDHVICLNGHVCCSGTPSFVAKNPAYIELFGEHTASVLSLYKHQHEHSHSIDGSIIK